MAVPSTEQEQDFVIHQPEAEEEGTGTNEANRTNGTHKSYETHKTHDETTDEFDLSDITATPQERSREDIIAAAEAAAFAES